MDIDPLLDLMRVLRPRAALFGGGFDAFGDWALGFRQRDDLLFCWIERGHCHLIRAGCPPVALQAGDFALIHTSAPFVLASDESVAPLDSETAVAATGRSRLRLGSGGDRAVALRAGKFIVSKANGGLLADLVPPVVHIAAADPSVGQIRALLAMNEDEARHPGPASEFVIVRLVELVLVAILRAGTLPVGREAGGLLAGLADPVTANALREMHRDVAHDWTVDSLARACGVSRSTFASRFRAVVGKAPIDYLLQWRIALAKDALSTRTKSVGAIAFSIGFQSPSAFTTAFTRAVGCSPTRFARSVATPPANDDPPSRAERAAARGAKLD